MPDLDIVARSLSKPWRGAYLLMKRGSPPQVVADALSKALAASVRDDGGIPGFNPMMRVCQESAERRHTPRTFAEVTRNLENQFQQQQAVKILARSARSYVAQIEAGNAPLGEASLAKEYLDGVLDYHFYSRVTHRVVGNRKRFATMEEARAYESAVRSQLGPKVHAIALRLATNPENSKVRAPKSSRALLTTEELLGMPIDRGPNQW